MNVSGIVNFAVKAGTGVGVHSVVSSGCRMVLPEATNMVQAVTNGMANFALTGVFTNLAWQYVDQTQAGIELLIKKLKEKPVKKTEKVTAE